MTKKPLSSRLQRLKRSGVFVAGVSFAFAVSVAAQVPPASLPGPTDRVLPSAPNPFASPRPQATARQQAAVTAPNICVKIEEIGNNDADKRQILGMINETVAGRELRLNNRKSLQIYNAENLVTRGCQISFRLNARLERKFRRDGDGHVNVSGAVSYLTDDALCLDNVGVASVQLSNTANIGEEYAEVILRKLFEGENCYGVGRAATLSPR